MHDSENPAAAAQPAVQTHIQNQNVMMMMMTVKGSGQRGVWGKKKERKRGIEMEFSPKKRVC